MRCKMYTCIYSVGSLMALFLACSGQVTVEVNTNEYYIEQEEAQIVCSYTGSDILVSIKWIQGAKNVASYDHHTKTIVYPDAAYQPPNYIMSNDTIATGSSFTIAHVIFENDKSEYTCEVAALIIGPGVVTFTGKANLAVYVLPNLEDTKLKVNGVSKYTGDTISATEDESQTLNLAVEEIFPAATFQWTVDSTRTCTLSETVHYDLRNGLKISTSTATWIPELSDKQLKCVVTCGLTKLNITLMLDVTATTKPVLESVQILMWLGVVLIIIGIGLNVCYMYNKRKRTVWTIGICLIVVGVVLVIIGAVLVVVRSAPLIIPE